jgi:hypothetical protein
MRAMKSVPHFADRADTRSKTHFAPRRSVVLPILLAGVFLHTLPGGTLLYGAPNKTAVVTSITPSTTGVGGSSFSLTVVGSNFTGKSVGLCNGNTRSTTVISSTQLSMTVLSSDIASVGTLQMAVWNPGGASNSVSLTVKAPAISIVTAGLPGGTVGTAYSAAVVASGGVPPYTWALASGPLPSGLVLSASGAISGTPTGSGTYSFTVQATDSAGTKASHAYSVTIAGVPTSSLSITTTSLPNDTVGTAYNATLTATGGTSPYTWSLASGALPSGLALSASGIISSIPTASGSYTFTVQVNDSVSHSASKSYTVSIASLLNVTSTSLPNGAAGTAYAATLSAAGGTPPYSWSVATGSLPTGLVLNASGALSGTPTTSGVSIFTVQATDAAHNQASKTLSISICGTLVYCSRTDLALVPYPSNFTALAPAAAGQFYTDPDFHNRVLRVSDPTTEGLSGTYYGRSFATTSSAEQVQFSSDSGLFAVQDTGSAMVIFCLDKVNFAITRCDTSTPNTRGYMQTSVDQIEWAHTNNKMFYGWNNQTLPGVLNSWTVDTVAKTVTPTTPVLNVPNSASCLNGAVSTVTMANPPTTSGPAVSALATGTLPAGTYYVAYSYTSATQETPTSGWTKAVLGSAGSLVVGPPAPETGATGYNVYVGLSEYYGDSTQSTINRLQGRVAGFTSPYTQSAPLSTKNGINFSCGDSNYGCRGSDFNLSGDDTRLAGVFQRRQDLAGFVYVFDKTLGCRWLNTTNGQIGGEWGTTGAVSGDSGFYIHNARVSRDGQYVRMTVATNSYAPSGGIVGGFPAMEIWDLATNVVTACGAGSPDYCLGHVANNFTQFMTADGGPYDEFQGALHDFAAPNSPTMLFTDPTTQTPSPVGVTNVDVHRSWVNAVHGQNSPIFGTSYQSNPDASGNYLPRRGWENEVIGMAVDGSHLVWRFAHTFASGHGTASAFYTEPRGGVSQDGKYYLFNSDFSSDGKTCTLGTDPSQGNGCRYDVFLVELK